MRPGLVKLSTDELTLNIGLEWLGQSIVGPGQTMETAFAVLKNMAEQIIWASSRRYTGKPPWRCLPSLF